MMPRPLKIKTPAEFEKKANAYFADCEARGKRPTVTGLSRALGFATRKGLFDYRRREEFEYVANRAVLRVEESYEEMLDGQFVTGAIFALKNMGWSDQIEKKIETTHRIEKIEIELIPPKPRPPAIDAEYTEVKPKLELEIVKVGAEDT
jgi:hypothetical protein